MIKILIGLVIGIIFSTMIWAFLISSTIWWNALLFNIGNCEKGHDWACGLVLRMFGH